MSGAGTSHDGSAAALLERWSELSESALRAVEDRDIDSLVEIVRAREELLSVLTRERRFSESELQGWLETEGRLAAQAGKLREALADELRAVRVARGRLGRSAQAHEPVFTSRRA